VLKLNGKTGIPAAADPVSPVSATVEEAVRLGADAAGCTLCAGTPAQERDFAQYNVFQRSHDESLRLVSQLMEILAKYPS
jgi:fructose-bisphosphate aldolase, class I